MGEAPIGVVPMVERGATPQSPAGMSQAMIEGSGTDRGLLCLKRSIDDLQPIGVERKSRDPNGERT